mgnify:CR=1 FL=1
MASIWEKAISFLAGNLNSGLITTVQGSNFHSKHILRFPKIIVNHWVCNLIWEALTLVNLEIELEDR